MAWKRVESYWLGYSLATRQFYFYYKLVGESSVEQIFPTPQEFLALADTFRNEGPINFNTDGQYFISAAEEIGEQEGHPTVVGSTGVVNLAEYVTYGPGISAEDRRANRKGYKTAYDLANKLGKTLYQNAGDLEIEIDETGDFAGGGEKPFWIGVRLNGDVNIVGAGIDRTRIKFFPDTVTFNACAFYQESGRHNSIAECTITGPDNGSDIPNPLFFGIKHQGEADAADITDEMLTLRNVKIDGEFSSALESNEGDLICTLDGCDISAYVKAVGYHVNVDTHKQLIIRNCHFHDTGLALDNAALVYVSPGVAIDISHSRFSQSLRFGVYIWTVAGVAVKPLYSRITNNVFEETLVNAIQVSGKSRPLIQGNLIKTKLMGIHFFGSHLGAEVLDNEVVQPEEVIENWSFIGGVSWASGAHVKVQGNTVDASAGVDVGESGSAIIRPSGTGVVWDIADNVFRLNHPKLSGIEVMNDDVLAFVSSNKFTGGECATCMAFKGGTVYARGNVIEVGSGRAFSFIEDTLGRAYIDDNDVAASVMALDISLTSKSAGKIRGSGNNFASDRVQVNGLKDFKYQMITPKTGVCPTVVASGKDTRLPMSYDTIHISGNAPIDNFYYYDANVTKLFCGEVRVIFDDEGAATTGEGNIKPQTTGERVVGKVYRFVLDSRTGWWHE